MKVAMGSRPEPATLVVTPEMAREKRLPVPGEQFGGYRIVRELGRGGMGAVFEAEHLESGRRVALKVLSHQLDSPDARARFLREGRLAASINHPNSVYVFGTDEIEGTPVIVMEMVAGGTLQQRVERYGRLAPAAAVDAILQVIAGLEAAQAIGILHRDIKPANCFEDADGMVKVGDFGLSISTEARAETNLTVQGAFLGTPAFCSPEQLRGDELSVRSDIYSVGVTLYYLLTGRTPFEGRNMVQLLANVIEQPAQSPRAVCPDIAPPLAAAVLRCLAKQPGDRFKSYEELRQALVRFSSDAPVPAPLPVRLLAGIIDVTVFSALGAALTFGVLGGVLMRPFDVELRGFFALMAGGLAVWLLYYGITEGVWGASLGKALCRLRVIGKNRTAPGMPRAVLRAAIFIVTPVLPYWILFEMDPRRAFHSGGDLLHIGISLSYYALVALLFSTARQRNGLAAVHDLLSATRVVRHGIRPARPALRSIETAAGKNDAGPKVGPYHVIEPIGAGGEWLLGYDTRLLRKVWIRVSSPGAPPFPAPLRSVGRVGRLRWISGRRTPDEAWDAFEGITGEPLLALIKKPQPWTSVRFWLLDLATELAAAERDGTLPPVLALDRVWITAEGRAKLLDFAAPGLPRSNGPPPVLAAPTPFLVAVARSALAGDANTAFNTADIRQPLPLHAQSFLRQLGSNAAPAAAVTLLNPLLYRVAVMSRARRAALAAGCISFPLLAALAASFGMRMLEQWQRAQPNIMELAQILNTRAAYRMPWMSHVPKISDETFGVFIAHHYAQVITNADWNTLYAVSMIQGEKRAFAERALAEYTNATPAQINQSEAAIKPMLPSANYRLPMHEPWFVLLIAGISLAFYVAVPALIAALIFRGGLVLLAAGTAIVRNDGTRASRLRVFWRSIVTWSPVFVILASTAVIKRALGADGAAVAATAMLAILTAVSLLLPDRGLADRLAGTRLVPR